MGESPNGHIIAHKGELVGAVYISAGSACLADNKGLTVEALYQQADKLMYQDKSAYYKQNGRDRRHR